MLRTFLYLIAVVLVFISVSVEASTKLECERERNTAFNSNRAVEKALRASVFGGDGVRYISRDLDLNGIGDVLEYLDRRFLPLVARNNLNWAQYAKCISEKALKKAQRKIGERIQRIDRQGDCNMLLHAWTRCLRDEPVNGGR